MLKKQLFTKNILLKFIYPYLSCQTNKNLYLRIFEIINIMRSLFYLLIFSIPLAVFGQKNAQEIDLAKAQIAQLNELYFKVDFSSSQALYSLPKFVSIDKVDEKNKTFFAYIPGSKFEDLLSLEIPFEVVDKSNGVKALTMATTTAEMANWDRYPTYSVYQQMMQDFADDYPDICRLESIGTSQNGRDISVLKITDNPDVDENEPEFFYTGTMHGDELAGFVLLLRLADHLLSNYGSDTQVDDLVNNVEIWINPNANPDGTYNGGNNTVSSSVRYLANGVDANRNFPDPFEDHPDGNAWAQETIDMMNFADNHQIVISANMHGGAEVVNYPWDAWRSVDNVWPYIDPPLGVNRLHPDDDWWQLVSWEYANSANYFSGVYNDITGSYEEVVFGADWYPAAGSRQDYMTYHKNGREFTLELSDSKQLDSNLLPTYWNYNDEALLLYMEQVLYGIHGVITDSVTGDPIEAKVEIVGHDDDISFVNSTLPVGDYHRPIYAGTYDVTYSKTGYDSQTHTISLGNYETVIKDVALHPTGVGIAENELLNQVQIAPNPVIDNTISLNINQPIAYMGLQITDEVGKVLYHKDFDNVSSGQLQITDIQLSSGIYILQISNEDSKISKKLIVL